MQSKLTLRLDEALIEQAKIYAKQNDKSLSQVVADYFQVLTRNIDDREAAPVPRVTQSLVGIIKDIDEREYKKHLEDKYL